jgi:hypothetical protein
MGETDGGFGFVDVLVGAGKRGEGGEGVIYVSLSSKELTKRWKRRKEWTCPPAPEDRIVSDLTSFSSTYERSSTSGFSMTGRTYFRQNKRGRA